jgi:TonB family protein
MYGCARLVLAAAAALAPWLTEAVRGATADWEALVREGVQADDVADYKTAQATLTEACEIAVSEPGSGPQTTACTTLATVHAIADDLKAARQVLEALSKRLTDLPEANPGDVVEALTTLANVHSANGSTDDAVEAMRSTLQYQERLAPLEKAHLQFRIAEFYLPLADKDAGKDLLLISQRTLASAVDYGNPEYVAAAMEFVWLLRAAGRNIDAERVVEKLLAEGGAIFAGSEAPNAELGAAYLEVAHERSARRGRRDNDPSDPGSPANLVRTWTEKLHGTPDPSFAKGEVSAPKLLSKRDPAYTRGARDAGVEGTVLLEVEIWPDGKAHNVRIVRKLPYGLAWAAIGAVRQWRFAPGVKNGEPVKVAVSVEINFRLGR